MSTQKRRPGNPDAGAFVGADRPTQVSLFPDAVPDAGYQGGDGGNPPGAAALFHGQYDGDAPDGGTPNVGRAPVQEPMKFPKVNPGGVYGPTMDSPKLVRSSDDRFATPHLQQQAARREQDARDAAARGEKGNNPIMDGREAAPLDQSPEVKKVDEIAKDVQAKLRDGGVAR